RELEAPTAAADPLARGPRLLVDERREVRDEARAVASRDAADVSRVRDDVLQRVGGEDPCGRLAVAELRWARWSQAPVIELASQRLERVGPGRVLAEDRRDDRRAVGIRLDPDARDLAVRQDLPAADVPR